MGMLEEGAETGVGRGRKRRQLCEARHVLCAINLALLPFSCISVNKSRPKSQTTSQKNKKQMDRRTGRQTDEWESERERGSGAV